MVTISERALRIAMLESLLQQDMAKQFKASKEIDKASAMLNKATKDYCDASRCILSTKKMLQVEGVEVVT